MSKRGRKRKGKPVVPTEMPMVPPGTMPTPPGMGIPTPPPSPKMTAQQRKLNTMVKNLVTTCGSLALKVAACGCSKKDKCGVYLKAREIAKIVDQMQDLEPPT